MFFRSLGTSSGVSRRMRGPVAMCHWLWPVFSCTSKNTLRVCADEVQRYQEKNLRSINNQSLAGSDTGLRYLGCKGKAHRKPAVPWRWCAESAVPGLDSLTFAPGKRTDPRACLSLRHWPRPDSTNPVQVKRDLPLYPAFWLSRSRRECILSPSIRRRQSIP